MNKQTIKQIFKANSLKKPEKIEKIEIGFTNQVFSIDNKFILKICQDTKNEKSFDKEVFFYNLFKKDLPVPKVIVYNKSKKIHNRVFMIYKRIGGDNLYSKWHLMSNSQRKAIIKQLCNILKTINKKSTKSFTKKYNLSSNINWKTKITSKINKHLKQIEKRKILSKDLTNSIKEFVKTNSKILDQKKIALVYWDAHFDNILVKNNKIVGILDFERTELASIDFVLDIVKRMQEYPSKYMAEEWEKYAKKKDYANLMEWFKESYPEIFKFKELDKRLALYTIEHDLDTILGWPKTNQAKKAIEKIVNSQ